MRTEVWITTRFEGFHRWKDAPKEVSFLRELHRHVFHVRLGKHVNGMDREIEFITLKRDVDFYIAEHLDGQVFDLSCEMLAAQLLGEFGASFVEVSEDGENGATVVGNVTSIKRDKCFVGIEAEGPFRGEVVLFIPGCTSPTRLDNLLREGVVGRYGVKRFYYGAGNDRGLREDTLEYLSEGQLPVDVEGEKLDSYSVLSGKWKGNLVSLDFAPVMADYRKWIDHSLIIWESLDGIDRYTTSVYDPLFGGDFCVEES